ncbi:MAG TPA: filamentous hemagglutinin family protein [Nitrospirota bacterium]|nr:filamentous hemagglutinin family protein [Nitrospirota bacterium]
MKTDIVQTLLRLLCCALILFPQSALAGSVVSIPGFGGSVAVRPPVMAAPAATVPGAPSNAPLAIPGFYNKALVPAVPANEVPVVLPGNNTGLDTSKGNQGIETSGNADSGQVTVYQNQQNAIINWQTFNIGSNSSVYFNQQGNASWAALNRIWDANPSQIYGKLSADGKIYLINQNGILFGPGSTVNVNSLIASALNIHDSDFLNNILHFILENYQNLSSPDTLAALSNFGEINAANGGYVFLMAPRVENFGTINAPAGQIGLAAGTDVTLMSPGSNDLSRSGYYVLINDDFINAPKSTDATFGKAVNQEGGILHADGGLVGMYGNNVEQWGVIRSVTAFQNNKGQVELRAANKITTGADSSVELPVDDSLDPQTGQPRTVSDTFDIQPNVFIGGLISNTAALQIDLGGKIIAPAGNVTLMAANQVTMESTSGIDVSGVKADLPVAVLSNFALNSVELRDAYDQKGGVLQGAKITTTLASGSAIGDISQTLLTQDKTAQERLIGGDIRKYLVHDPTGQVPDYWVYQPQTGNISITAANGGIDIKQGASLDFSGGAIQYQAGLVNTTKLLSGTKIYDISNAPEDIQYNAILGNYEKIYNRFGIQESYTGLYYGGASPVMTYVNGYTTGGDAGSLSLKAPMIVLNGQLNGSVTRGTYQNALTMQSNYSTANDYNEALMLSKTRGLEMPQAGSLSIMGTSNIAVVSETDTQTDHATGIPLPAGQTTLVSAKILNDAHLGAVNLTADLTISTAVDAALTLQPGGSFTASTRLIDHEGDITVPGGTITLFAVQNSTGERDSSGNLNPNPVSLPNGLSERIILGKKSVLDTSGERIDNSQTGTNGNDVLGSGRVNGGTIVIKDNTDQGAGVFIQTGAIVDVSGGYTINQKGNITGGNAGSLSIQGANIQLDGDIRGYALADPNGNLSGGQIQLAAPNITVAPASSIPGNYTWNDFDPLSADPSRSQPPADMKGVLYLPDDLLKSTGFTSITLNSVNDVIIDKDSKFGPSPYRLNNPLNSGSGTRATIDGQVLTGDSVPGKPDLIQLDDAQLYMAGPSKFVASAGVPFGGSSGLFTNNLRSISDPNAPKLSVSDGAVVQTTPGTTGSSSSISLSGPNVTVYGELDSRAGNITITATGGNLLIGDSASILANGYNRPNPSSTPNGNPINYQPINGGTVSLIATPILNAVNTGNLTIAATALIDVSGSDMVQNSVLSDGKISTYETAGSPGSVSLTYGGVPDLKGAIVANRAQLNGLSGISGGTLAMTYTYPDPSSIAKANEMSISDYIGYFLSTGFDDLTFRSNATLNFDGGGISYVIPRKLTLDAPNIIGAGNTVTLSSPWIVLTNSSKMSPPVETQPVMPAAGSLTLAGGWTDPSGALHSGFIDVIGDIQLDGFRDVTLQTDRDIRLSQVLYDNNCVGGDCSKATAVYPGTLRTTGNLVLDAARLYPGAFYSNTTRSYGNNIYPSIYSDYTVHANGKVTLQHTVGNTDNAVDTPIYSAGGNLTIEGLGGIELKKDVTVAAPMGTITLSAPGKRIYLDDGSVLTTAGSPDFDVNYGAIDSNNLWLVQDKANPNVQSGSASLFTQDSLPQKSITMNADEVIAREGSVIDVSGGGSVFAYTFQPGVQGSVDPLTKSGRYIVFKADSFPMPGTTVYLQGGGGLSAGLYTLLPLDAKDPQNARFAFMPGAYIIEAQSTTSLPGPGALSIDGYPLTVGFTAIADTSIKSTRPQVYSVRTAAEVIATEGSYVKPDSFVSGNAGDIIIAGNTTVLDGKLNAAALSGYQGGKISLAATDVFVQSSAASPLPADFQFGTPLAAAGITQGTMNVSADSLSGKGFSEVDLGNGNTNSVTVRSGAALDADVLTLSANQAVTVESGAKLGVVQTTTGMSGTDRISLSTPGELAIASGASVYASQSITLDVNDVKDISGELKSDSGSLTLKSTVIFFGGDNGKAPTDVGLYLTGTLWNRFSTFSDISLISKNDIQFRTDFTGGSALSAGKSLTLNAAQITGVNSGGASVTLTAPTVNLTNTGTSSAAVTTANAGAFTVNADQINIGTGDVLFGGFSTIGLNSKNDLTFIGMGSLTTGNADLLIGAARITTASTTKTANNSNGTTTTAVTATQFTVYTGANYLNDQNNPSPTGSITITNSGGTPGTTSSPGGTLEFQGRSIDQGGVIRVDGGTVRLSATGPGQADGVTLRSGSQILAQGTADAPGGQVFLNSINGGIVMEGAAVDANGATVKPASLIDVSADSQGDAGTISLQAPLGGVLINGDLKGTAKNTVDSQGDIVRIGQGGSFILHTDQINDLAGLNSRLASGGFTESLDLWARTGNIDIASGQILQARHIKLTVDDTSTSNGQINIAGQIIATDGGSVELYAANNLTIQSGGSVNATNAAAGSSGGSVLLSTAYAGTDPLQGWINVNGTIDVSGGAGGTGGTIYLRAQRNVTDVKINLGGTLQGAASVYAEAVKRYDYSVPSLLTSTQFQTWLNEAASYDAANTAVGRLQGAAPAGSSSFHLLPGIEVVNSGGDITIDAPIEMSLLGADTNPGVLSLRAKGNLNINNNLTDYPAYAASGNNPVTSLPSGRNSWGFNLAAGADTSSADPLAVNSMGTGALTIANNTVVYTESAPILFASGGDTFIGTGPQIAYVYPNYMISPAMYYNLASFSGSIRGNVGRDLSVAGAIQTATGDIDISVGRNLNLLAGGDYNNPGAGAIRTTGQLTSTDAVGTSPLDPTPIDPATGQPFNKTAIQQSDLNGTYYWRYDNGGNVTLSVGGNAGKLNSSGMWVTADGGAWDYFSPIDVTINSHPSTYGLFSADYLYGTAGLSTMGGGNLSVRTGGDFLAQAGTFGAGDLTIYSGGDINGRFLNHGSTDEAGRAEIHAQGNFGAYNPASLENDRAQIELFNSKMNVTAQGEMQIGAILNPSLASDEIDQYRASNFVYLSYTPETTISLKAGTDITLAGRSPFYANPVASQIYERVLPANVNVVAGGDILLLNDFTLASASDGNLILHAGGDVIGQVNNGSGGQRSARILVSDMAPNNWYGLFYVYGDTDQKGGWIASRTVVNRHGIYNPIDQSMSVPEDGPLHTGDPTAIEIHADRDITGLNLMLPKKAEVTAGRDITNITYEGQNIAPDDISMIQAGRDISMQYVKASDSAAQGGLIQGGPGTFLIQAGGSIDLGSLSGGIQEIGNGNNPALATGATGRSSLVVLSGYGFDQSSADIEAFFKTIRDAGDQYAKLMAQGSRDEADQLLQTTRQDTIEPLLGKPSGPGDINMTSSQISTSNAASDISIIANGDLNLGKTALPSATAVNTTSGITTANGGAINIFTVKDVNVQESRVMTFFSLQDMIDNGITADDIQSGKATFGDITVWSDQGSINAGRGSRTAVSASPPKLVPVPGAPGVYRKVFTPPAVGSGIRALTYGENAPIPGNVHLFAPTGVIDAGEAGIAGGKITLAALQVNNASNINFSAGSVGLPQASEGSASLGALTGTTSATQTSQLTADASGLTAAKVQASQMVEDIIAKWLEVKVIDFVEEDDNNKDDNNKDDKKKEE